MRGKYEQSTWQRQHSGDQPLITNARKLFYPLFLAVITVCIYWQTGSHGFCLFDDGDYVVNNPAVLNGLNLESVSWAFSSVHSANWHPLTWLSHMLDVQLFGMNPSAHHRVNAVLHALNAALVFLLLMQLTTATWRSLFVATLFALHPLHVESVAWIAERKDVLSALFFLLTLLAWTSYVRKQTPGRYLCSLALYALGLMAKPMLVTLPFVLLLLDWWPLGRCGIQRRPSRLFVEKIPFFALSLGSSLLTLLVQYQGGAVSTFVRAPITLRIANALTAYGVYLRKMLWPSDLGIMYPLPTLIDWWQPVLWGIFIVVITLGCLRLRHRHPYLLVGWLWYLGMLVPVIGLVQVGSQAMADRYTYLPLLGPFIMISWGASTAATGYGQRRAVIVFAVVVAGILAAATWRQIGFWKSDELLFSRALEVSPANPVARTNLSMALLNEGLKLKAQFNYDAALKRFALVAACSTGTIAAGAHNNMGLIHAMQGRTAAAEREYAAAVQYDATSVDPYYNRALLQLQEGRFREAATSFREVLKLDPGNETARQYLEEILKKAAPI